jgi:hypothetical protein
MGKLLDIDPEVFERNFAREPFSVSHHLTAHPLLSLESLGQLADRLPADKIEHNVGELPEVLTGEAARRSELSPGEIARTIETNGCWMVLKNIELDRDYKRLLDETLDEAAGLVAGREGGMQDREGFIFLSAPGSVTPSHIDPEHNFLLQVRGTKDMNVGAFPDAAAQQLQLERYYRGEHRNVEWLPEAARTFPLEPGDGVYVPVHAPHFVRNGPQASVSLSVTFFTPQTRQDAAVHFLNARLRRMRMTPRPPGARPSADRVKALVARGLRRIAA